MNDQELRALAIAEVLRAVATVRAPQKADQILMMLVPVSGAPIEVCSPVLINAVELLVRMGVVAINDLGEVSPSKMIGNFVWDDLDTSGRRRAETCETTAAPAPTTLH